MFDFIKNFALTGSTSGKPKSNKSKTSTKATIQPQTTEANPFADWIANYAGGLEHEEDYLAVGKRSYHRTMMITSQGWPHELSPGWMKLLLSGMLQRKVLHFTNMTIALHFAPSNVKWNEMMKWKYKRLKRSVSNVPEGELPNPDEKKALDALEYLQQANVMGGSILSDMWGVFTISTESKELLEDATHAAETELTKTLKMQVTKLPMEQKQGFLQSWVAGAPDEKFFNKYKGRVVNGESAAHVWPITYGTLTDFRGIYVGNRTEPGDGSATYIDMNQDIEGEHNYAITGKSGEGKSTLIKGIVTSLLEEGYIAFAFDVDGEYRKMCDKYNGEWIDQTMGTGRYIEPLMIYPPIQIPRGLDLSLAKSAHEENMARLAYAKSGLKRMVSLLAGGVSPEESNAADRALMRLLDRLGVDEDDHTTWDNLSSSIHEWYGELEWLVENTDIEGCKPLANKLWQYFRGSQKDLFSRPEKLNLQGKDMYVFHVASSINNQDEQHIGAVKIALATNAVWDAVRRNRILAERFAAVIYDEGQRLLLNDHASENVNTMATTVRKFNGLTILATNKPSVFFDTVGGAGFWSNSAYKALFWCEPNDLRRLAENADIPDSVIAKLKTLKKTKQFVFREPMKGWDVLRLQLPPEERELYKTRGLRGQVVELDEEDEGEYVDVG